jgi:hypothetical protein
MTIAIAWAVVAKRPTLHLRRDKPAVTDNTERERIHEVTDNA